MGRLRRLIFGIPDAETTFAKRGFASGGAAQRARLELIGRTFVGGYHAALIDDDPGRLAARLEEVEPELRGFAYEGAAMALTLSDYFSLGGGGRWRRFLEGPGRDHEYMIYVGAGWAMARLPRRRVEAFEEGAPLLRWLVIDGYGFHEGYFHFRRYEGGRAPKGLPEGYALRVFDQGLGRSLWFVECADAGRLGRTIESLPAARRADLWSGVGLACGYAGGAGRAQVVALKGVAGDYLPALGQGVAFAAKTRLRAGNMAPQTELACETLCGMSAAEAAALTDEALAGLPADGDVPSFEVWRQRIQAQVAAGGRAQVAGAALHAGSHAAQTTEVWR